MTWGYAIPRSECRQDFRFATKVANARAGHEVGGSNADFDVAFSL